ncbi:MAG TPA: N-acetyl-alpha-D-glucosaminyl L-malate synthase BshA [Gemmataceae bacterium]|nr:N-acetyl-alpha-D-glucosaminyl L-malate synthase BshA [Gemmataceae bacterium]
MRIGVLCHSSLGGSARVGTELALGMAERGHHVHVFARSAPLHLRPGLPRMHLHPLAGPAPVTARLDANWSPEDLDALVGLVATVAIRERLDVLHFHYAVPFALVAASVRRRLGSAAPVLVGTLHGTDVSAYGCDAKVGPPLARALRAVDQLTTVSECYARLATDVFRLPAPPRVIPNFVDLTRFRPRSDRERRLEDRGGRFLIVHISNFRPVKDPLAVARIFLRLQRRLPVSLWLIGVGSELPAVRAVLSGGGAEGHVQYLGYQEDVSELLARADLLLMASRAESFCLAALEAMACGVPVLASAVGGLTELVGHGRHGFLYPLDDHEQAEQLGVELLSDRDRYAEMCRQAVCRAGQFDREQVIDLYEDLYRGLIGRRSAVEVQVGDLSLVDGLSESWCDCTS